MPQTLITEKVSAVLKKCRENKGLSQSELADILQVGLRTYQRYESGESTPTIDVVFHLSKVLKFELKDLFDEDSSKTNLPQLKVYSPEEADEFLNHRLVRDSKLMELYKSKELASVLKSGDCTQVRDVPLFRDNQYGVALSTVKTTVLNPALVSVLNFTTDTNPTASGHMDKMRMSYLWAEIIDNDYCFFKDLADVSFPSGNFIGDVLGIYISNKKQNIILSAMDIHKIG
jgi:transcriptional regulator with XRE-family HTH domain